MILNPFQVRLKDNTNPNGFKVGLVGTVVGLIPTKTEQGVVEVYKVLWFNFNEETGDTTPYIDAAAPSSHLATELVSFVNEFDIDEDEDEDHGDDLFDEPPLTQTSTAQPSPTT